MLRPRIDLLPAVASAMTVAVFGAYVAIIRSQEGSLLPWVIALFAIGAAGSADGAARNLPHRRLSLGVAAAGLLVLGTLGILTIGLPLLGAGTLCVVALARQTTPSRPNPSGSNFP